MPDCTLWEHRQHVAKLGRPTCKILLSSPVSKQPLDQPPVDSPVMKDQQSQRWTPRGAVKGRDLDS